MLRDTGTPQLEALVEEQKEEEVLTVGVVASAELVARRAPLKATQNQQCSLAAFLHAQMEQTPAALLYLARRALGSDRARHILLLRPQDILQ